MPLTANQLPPSWSEECHNWTVEFINAEVNRIADVIENHVHNLCEAGVTTPRLREALFQHVLFGLAERLGGVENAIRALHGAQSMEPSPPSS